MSLEKKRSSHQVLEEESLRDASRHHYRMSELRLELEQEETMIFWPDQSLTNEDDSLWSGSSPLQVVWRSEQDSDWSDLSNAASDRSRERVLEDMCSDWSIYSINDSDLTKDKSNSFDWSTDTDEASDLLATVDDEDKLSVTSRQSLWSNVSSLTSLTSLHLSSLFSLSSRRVETRMVDTEDFDADVSASSE